MGGSLRSIESRHHVVWRRRSSDLTWINQDTLKSFERGKSSASGKPATCGRRKRSSTDRQRNQSNRPSKLDMKVLFTTALIAMSLAQATPPQLTYAVPPVPPLNTPFGGVVILNVTIDAVGNVRNISVVTGTWPFVKAFLLPEGLAFLPKPFVNLDMLLTKVQELPTEPTPKRAAASFLP